MPSMLDAAGCLRDAGAPNLIGSRIPLYVKAGFLPSVAMREWGRRYG